MVSYKNPPELLRRTMKKLDPHIERHQSAGLFPTQVVMSTKEKDKVRDLIQIAINLGGDLPEGLLREFDMGLRDEDTSTPPEDFSKAPF